MNFSISCFPCDVLLFLCYFVSSSFTVYAYIADQVGKYINNHLSRMVYAYKKGHGCAQLLSLAVNSLKWCLDDGLPVGILLMDLS